MDLYDRMGEDENATDENKVIYIFDLFLDEADEADVTNIALSATSPKFDAIAWSYAGTVEEVANQMAKFHRRLVRVEFDFERDSVSSLTRFKVHELHFAEKLFFHTVFGEGGLEQVRKLVNCIRRNENGSTPRNPGYQAQKLSRDPDIPIELRTLFRAYSRSAIHEAAISPIGKLLDMHNRYEFCRHLHQFHLLDEDPERCVEIKRFLRNKNPKYESSTGKRGRGRGWKTVVLDYLADALEFVDEHGVRNKNKFRSFCQNSHPFGILASEFGPGILVFLPGDVTHS